MDKCSVCKKRLKKDEEEICDKCIAKLDEFDEDADAHDEE